MLDRLGLERRDGRIMLVVGGVVAAAIALTLTEATVFVRVMTGLIAGGISGVVFLIATVVINQFKPDHW